VVTRHPRTESGAAAVELALVIPLVVMLLAGVVAFGIVFAQQLSLGNAARQAARYGVVADRSCAQIVGEAQRAATTIDMAGRDVTVDVRVGATRTSATPRCTDPAAVPCDGSQVGDNVYVTVRHTSRLVVPLAVVEQDFDLDGTGVFRCEFS
jgi:Flp pilus assembly protein TadG